jgi:hypothetical protein
MPPATHRLRLGALGALLGTALLLSACGSAPSEGGGLTHVVPAAGQGKPRAFRSLPRALRQAEPGDTLVLAPGRYGGRGRILRIAVDGTADKPILIRGRRGARPPRLLGQVRLEGDHLRVRRVLFDGPTGRVTSSSADNPGGEDVQVWVRGRDVTIARSEVRDNLWHAGVYVTGDDARLIGNHIHDNGDRSRPERWNLDHGVYWASGSGGLASDNLVAGNVAYGIHLYPEPRGIRVLQNTLVRNGRSGLILADRTAQSVVANNIVALNGSPSIDFDLYGRGNVVVNNLFWSNGESPLDRSTLLGRSTPLVADPLFRSAHNYRLAPGSAAIGRALPEFTTPTDLDGRPRPSRAADLGAFEAGG